MTLVSRTHLMSITNEIHWGKTGINQGVFFDLIEPVLHRITEKLRILTLYISFSKKI